VRRDLFFAPLSHHPSSDAPVMFRHPSRRSFLPLWPFPQISSCFVLRRPDLPRTVVSDLGSLDWLTLASSLSFVGVLLKFVGMSRVSGPCRRLPEEWWWWFFV